MTPERRQQIEALYREARSLSTTDRALYLDRACDGDADLRHEIDALLASGSQSGAGTATLPSTEAPDSLALGTRLGPYRIDGVIGHGGMGQVYKAEDVRLGRFVALKFLRADVSNDSDALQRFRVEARTASALNHPNICTIYEIDEAGGRAFIAMELLEGQTLRERFRAKALRAEQLLDLAIQIADGLEAAHSKGIAHRDIKPENLFVVKQDRVKILDFGLAKLQPHLRLTNRPTGSESTTEAVDVRLTTPGLIVGTPAYMSPEQIRGDELDFRTDLFSFGSVLFEMATGKRAFEGRTVADLSAAILAGRPVLPITVDSRLRTALQAILDKALEKSREFRYQSAVDLAADLRRLRRDLDKPRLSATVAGGNEAPLRIESLGREMANDVIRLVGFAVLVFAVHGVVERRPSGKFLDDFQVAFVQESVMHGPLNAADFEPGGKYLPLVVDISSLHPSKKQRTDRRLLDLLIDELRRRGASAIGVDLTFDDIDGADFQYLQKWTAEGIVRVGIYRNAVERRETWLGRPEFSPLAAGIALPVDDPQHAFFYSRRWFLEAPLADHEAASPKDCGNPVDANCKEDLIQLPVALWLLSERQRLSSEEVVSSSDLEARLKGSLETLQSRAAKRTAGTFVEFGEYAIDYSYLKNVRQDVITLTPNDAGDSRENTVASLAAFASRIADRTVLVGDLEDTSDQACPTPSMKPVSGVLIHACALATLNRGMIFRIAESVNWARALASGALLLAVVVGVRLLHSRWNLAAQWPYQFVEIVTFASMSVAVFLVVGWQVRIHGVMWPHSLWLCAALLLHPFVSEPLFRVVLATLRLLRPAPSTIGAATRGV